MQGQNSSRVRIPSSGPSATTKRVARNFRSSDVNIAVDFKICRIQNRVLMICSWWNDLKRGCGNERTTFWEAGTDLAGFGRLPQRKERS